MIPFITVTGLLVQSSVVYEVEIDTINAKKYYMMDYIGHTYLSDISGKLYRGNKGLTTAKKLLT
ncbi:MAG: hypothetical protein AAGI07_06505 [Bacteroidota bacterium]